jgi:hypothetical protein
MSDRRRHFTSASCGQFCEERRGKLAPHVGEGVAVEEKERGAAVALAQEFYGFGERGAFGLSAAPLCFKRSIAL